MYSYPGETDEVLQETPIVPIDVGPPTHTNTNSSGSWDRDAQYDLIGRLSAQLANSQDVSAKQSDIVEPSEVVAFQLMRPSSTFSTATTGPAPSPYTHSGSARFSFPARIYLDPFLRTRATLAEALRAQQHAAWGEVQKMILRKKSLLQFNVSSCHSMCCVL